MQQNALKHIQPAYLLLLGMLALLHDLLEILFCFFIKFVQMPQCAGQVVHGLQGQRIILRV